jgi:predicted DsbA family dithiol-disulfide isomerase
MRARLGTLGVESTYLGARSLRSRMADVRITEYTDPGCPWAYSAEPYRRRLEWLYGDDIEWQVRMVVLAESPDDYTGRGFTPDKQAAAFKRISRDHGMPIDTRERPRMAATRPACHAVVAARVHEPQLARSLLRCLRVHHFAADALLDEPEMLDLAAASAGIDRATLERWMVDPRAEQALTEDMAAAREPMRAARVLDHKLANWSGGRRYTCPSYEITRLADGVTISVPGFQPFAVYDVLLANLVPGTDRRPMLDDVADVLRWAGGPLATQEVAVLADIDPFDARERLGRVATERHVGTDGFWSLAPTA